MTTATGSDGFGTGSSSFGVGSFPSLSQSLWDNIYDEEDEYQDGGEQRPGSYNSKDCVIFLIDAQSSMFEPNETEEVPFQSAVKCAIATMTDKIISSESDLLGVCFYGTKEKNNLNEFEDIYVFQDLDVPDAQRILQLESLLKHEDSPFGSTENEFPFCDALWTCSTMFSNCTTKVAHKRIFLFTNDDNPNYGNDAVREQSLQRAKDLSELGIDIELFSINKTNETFDPTKFFENIISFGEDEFIGHINFDASAKFEELRARVRRKEFKKRTSGTIPFSLKPGFEIAVSVYKLISETKKNSYIWLDAKANQRVKIVTKWLCKETTSVLMNTQIGYYFPFGHEQIFFTKEELTAIKTIDTKGLRLMGFKDRKCLKDYFAKMSSSFLYPNEAVIKGSTILFAALLDRMKQMNKIAIARLTRRDNVAPSFVALLPQSEEFDEDGSQLRPPGLHMFYLPFADDIRKLKLPKTIPANEEQVEKAKQIVKKLRIRFDSRSFENPILQKHYAALQALALERDQVEAVPDYVLPDAEGMARFENLITEFKEAIYGAETEEDRELKETLAALKAQGKRKRTTKDEGGETKRTVKPVVKPEYSLEEYSNEIKVNKLTVAQLKLYLKEQGIPVASSDRKAILVNKVVDHALTQLEKS